MPTRSRVPSVPTTMKAAAIDRFGPPSVLELHDLPTPEPEADQILIAVHTAGIGGWDADIRAGEWRPPGARARFPMVGGMDGAGTVVAKGSRVRRFAVGDRVWGYDSNAGFSAQYVVVDADDAGRLPKRMTLRAAGAGCATGLTAFQGVADHAEVRRGQTVLVFGATGAVGTLAVQFAKARGARVIATATGKKATALVRSLGARVVIDARDRDAADEVRSRAPDGIDVVLAFAGGRGLERLLDQVSRGGRIVYPNGVEPEPERRSGVRLISYDAEGGADAFARLTRASEQARLKVPIEASYPLARAAEAHRRVKRGHVLGRVVLAVRRGED